MDAAKVDSRIGFEFLMAEIQVGIVFAGIASDALEYDTEKVQRNWRNAQLAHDTVLRFRSVVELDARQELYLYAGLSRLQSALNDLSRSITPHLKDGRRSGRVTRYGSPAKNL